MSKFRDLIQSQKLVLADFSASWCGPCQTMAPILKDVSSRVGSRARIVKIDVDNNQALAAKLNVRSVPTLILYKNGEPIWRQSGVLPADQLVKLIEGYDG
ncbi:MAG: thioredoxin [Crocinitomicaceae bacterium]|nr:thioredoxin [Crocinitomicaceae bacterium]